MVGPALPHTSQFRPLTEDEWNLPVAPSHTERWHISLELSSVFLYVRPRATVREVLTAIHDMVQDAGGYVCCYDHNMFEGISQDGSFWCGS